MDRVSVAFLGDGATSEGDFHEALNFAAVFHLPVIFFVQNNQYAISVPLAKQMAAPVYRRAFGFGFPGVQVDGNDVLAVYAVTKAAADRARDGGGPTLIEAITYRLGAHTTTDDPTRYRTSDELDMWKAREPIGRYRAFLERAGLWSEELERDVQAEADRVAAEVRDTVEQMPDPPLSDLVDHVYADPPATLLAGVAVDERLRPVGVDEIVTRAGVTKPSLYRAFPSKDDLAAAYLSDYDREFWPRFEKPGPISIWSFSVGFTIDGLFIFGLGLLAAASFPTGAVLAAGVAMSLRYASEILFAPVGGAIGHRFGALHMLVVMSLMTAGALLLLALNAVLGTLCYWLLRRGWKVKS